MDAGDSTRVQITRIENALTDISDHLATAPMSARIRELRARATSYTRVVSGWAFRPPLPAQCAAMLECVNELHTLLLGPTHHRPAPTHSRPHLSAQLHLPPSQRATRPPGTRHVTRPPHMRTTAPPPPPSKPPSMRF